jgi:peptide/nickel transport system permease protein
LLILLGVFGPVISPFHPMAIATGPRLQPPQSGHWMGTDNLGRDVLSRTLSGARASIGVGFSAAIASTIVGVLIGTIAGYFGGRLEDMLMRVTEAFMVIPRFFLALIAVALFGASIFNIIFAIAVLSWPVTARLVRSEFLTLRGRQFVDAARVIGTGTITIIFHEMLPNASAVIVVNSTLLCAQAMLLEAGLSYLGLGDPSTVSWGLMLFEAQTFLRDAWWMSVFPGLGIFLSVLCLNVVGDGLNDVLNPRAGELGRTEV